MSDIREQIGQRIADLRKERGLSQYELADRSGVGRSHIIRIEKGLYNVRIDILDKLAKALGCEIDIH